MNPPGIARKHPSILIAGVGSKGARVVQQLAQERDSLMLPGFVRVTSRNPAKSGLDAHYRFDKSEREAVEQLLGEVDNLILVTYAGGSTGTTLARFATMAARYRNIQVDAVLCLSADWEGGARRARSMALRHDLTSMGASDWVVDANAFFKKETTSTDDGCAAIDEKMIEKILQAVDLVGITS